MYRKIKLTIFNLFLFVEKYIIKSSLTKTFKVLIKKIDFYTNFVKAYLINCKNVKNMLRR